MASKESGKKEEAELPPLAPDQVLKSEAAVYSLVKRVGEGSFGELWIARMEKVGSSSGGGVEKKGGKGGKGRRVAVKLESEKSPTPSLHLEVKYYLKLGTHRTVPAIYDFFRSSGRNCMAMELLGKSIENRMDHVGRRMPVKDVLMIGMQVLDALEHMHSCHLIHRDIKPDNFLFGPHGKRSQDQLRVIDLGLAKQFKDDAGRHIDFNAHSMPMGTARYMSIRAHQGMQQSRRDDLEALAYMLIYLQRDRMPWDGIREADARLRNRRILEAKQATPVPQLLALDAAGCKLMPFVFAQLLQYAKKLKFKEDPDYDAMRAMLTGFAKAAHITLDGRFSWSDEDKESELTIKPQTSDNAKLMNRSNRDN